MLGPKEVDDSKLIQPLKEVIRIATPKDDAREESNRKKEKEAFEICQKKIRAHNLEMKLIDWSTRLTITRCCFTLPPTEELIAVSWVKDPAYVFKTRIELRQIGVRDRDKDPRRNWHLRQTALLPYVSVRVCTGFDQDG